MSTGTGQRAKVIAFGSAFPAQVLSNADLAALVDTSDAWIRERTGIHERRKLANGENNSDIGTAAALDCLAKAGCGPRDVDLIIACSNTPDRWLPSLGSAIAAKLGTRRGVPAYDVVTACAGWLAGLQSADALVRSGHYARVLVVGSEALTRYVDWTDRNTCILFGDGAGAALVGPAALGDRGLILDVRLHTEGRFGDIMSLPAGGTCLPQSQAVLDQRLQYIHMDGLEVFAHAVRDMAEVSLEVLAANGFSAADVAWFVPHQANLRIMHNTAKRLGIALDKVAVNIHKYGNTSTATIPTCFDEYAADGRIRPGDLVLMTAFGGGLTWGAGLIRW